MGPVTQNIQLFHATVRDNLTFFDTKCFCCFFIIYLGNFLNLKVVISRTQSPYFSKLPFFSQLRDILRPCTLHLTHLFNEIKVFT